MGYSRGGLGPRQTVQACPALIPGRGSSFVSRTPAGLFWPVPSSDGSRVIPTNRPCSPADQGLPGATGLNRLFTGHDGRGVPGGLGGKVLGGGGLGGEVIGRGGSVAVTYVEAVGQKAMASVTS